MLWPAHLDFQSAAVHPTRDPRYSSSASSCQSSKHIERQHSRVRRQRGSKADRSSATCRGHSDHTHALPLTNLMSPSICCKSFAPSLRMLESSRLACTNAILDACTGLGGLELRHLVLELRATCDDLCVPGLQQLRGLALQIRQLGLARVDLLQLRLTQLHKRPNSSKQCEQPRRSSNEPRHASCCDRAFRSPRFVHAPDR